MACLGTLTLCPRYKRENDRPRCPGTASSLSDSWCCQESLLLLSTDLLAKAGEQHRGAQFPCPPVSRIQEQHRYLLFSSPASSKPQSLHYCSQPQPASLTLPEYKLSSLFFQEGGLGPINLWTNVKESGGEGPPFKCRTPKSKSSQTCAAPPAGLCTGASCGSCQHNQPGLLNLRLSFRGGLPFLPACPDRP